MGKNTALVMVAAILGITLIAVTCILMRIDTGIATAAIGALGVTLGIGGTLILRRNKKG